MARHPTSMPSCGLLSQARPLGDRSPWDEGRGWTHPTRTWRDASSRPLHARPVMAAHASLRAARIGGQGRGVLGRADEHDRLDDDGKRSPMSDIDEATGVPEPARVESWLRRLIGFEDARVVAVVALTDGLSNVTCRVNLTDAPVAAAVLRIQPTRGIFEPYDILREGEVLKH